MASATLTEPPAPVAPVTRRQRSKFLEVLSVLTPPKDIIKHRLQWPTPELSIDREYQSLSRWNQRCWSAKGPAREQLVPVCREIITRLNNEEHKDELFNGVNTADWSIAVNLFMVGRNQKRARPVIIVCCRNATVRKNAMKMIRDMDILDAYESVKLGERAFSPLPVAGEGMAEIQQSDITHVSVMGEGAMVYYTRHLVTNPCGASIFVRISESESGLRDATMGGVVMVKGQYYGMTAAHASAGTTAHYSSASSEDSGLLIEDDDDSSTVDPSVSKVPKIVAMRFANNNSGIATPLGLASGPLPSDAGRKCASDLVELGAKLGPAWRDDELDWELFRIDNISYKAPNELPAPYRNVSLKWAPITEPPDADVLVMTGTTGMVRGRLSGTPFFLCMPGRKLFQEMWVVHMERKSKFGDCGSWVVDSFSGVIYGHVIAADGDVAYIVPAHQVSAGIEAALGFGPSLPTDDTSVSPDPEIQPSTSSGNVPDAARINSTSQEPHILSPTISSLATSYEYPWLSATLDFDNNPTSGVKKPTPRIPESTPIAESTPITESTPIIQSPPRYVRLLQTAMDLIKKPFGLIKYEPRTGIIREDPGSGPSSTLGAFVNKARSAGMAIVRELPWFLTRNTSDRNHNASEGHDESEDIHVNYVEGPRLNMRIFMLCFVSFCVGIDQRMIIIATPKITDNFRSLGDLGWYGSAYFLSVAIGHLCFRRIYYLWPSRTGFFCASLLFAVGGVLCLFVPHLTVVFVLGRALTALGAAGFLGSIPVITATMFPPQKRPLCLHSTHGAFCLGFVGSLIGGTFADRDLWKACFYLDIGVGSFAAITSFIFSEHRDHINYFFRLRRKELRVRRLLPIVILTGCAVCLSLALQWGGSKYPWHDIRIVILFVAFAVCLLLIVGYIQPYLRRIQRLPVRSFRDWIENFDLSFRRGQPAKLESIALRIITLPSILLDRATQLSVSVQQLDASNHSATEPDNSVDNNIFPVKGIPISGYLVLAAARGAYVQVTSTYLPIWFQSVKTTTALKSSIYTLPFILISAYISACVSPYSQRPGLNSSRRWLSDFTRLLSTVPAIIGSFLMTTLRFPSSKGSWIGYQILCLYFAGLGTLEPAAILELYPKAEGFCMVYTAIAFAEAMGSAIGIAAAQSVFLNSLVDRGRGIHAATIFRSTSEVPRGFLELYDVSLSRTYYVSAGAACVALGLTTLIWMTAMWRGRRTKRHAATTDAATNRSGLHTRSHRSRGDGDTSSIDIPLDEYFVNSDSTRAADTFYANSSSY